MRLISDPGVEVAFLAITWAGVAMHEQAERDDLGAARRRAGCLVGLEQSSASAAHNAAVPVRTSIHPPNFRVARFEVHQGAGDLGEQPVLRIPGRLRSFAAAC